jgi:hypothetical protein
LLAKGLLKTTGINTEDVILHAGYKNCNADAQPPLGNVASVVEYLGRYTHKVAITFRYKDYSAGSKQKEMTLSIAEFWRRFEIHFLPKRYVKIHHYIYLQKIMVKQNGSMPCRPRCNYNYCRPKCRCR